MSAHQVDRLITRLERAARIASTMHRIAGTRLVGDDAAQLRAHATTLTNTSREAIALLRTLNPDEEGTDPDARAKRESTQP